MHVSAAHTRTPDRHTHTQAHTLTHAEADETLMNTWILKKKGVRCESRWRDDVVLTVQEKPPALKACNAA